MKTNHGSRNPSKAYNDFLIGPIKIKDGLFMGDEASARVFFPLVWGYGFYHKQQSDTHHKYGGEESA